MSTLHEDLLIERKERHRASTMNAFDLISRSDDIENVFWVRGAVCFEFGSWHGVVCMHDIPWLDIYSDV